MKHYLLLMLNIIKLYIPYISIIYNRRIYFITRINQFLDLELFHWSQVDEERLSLTLLILQIEIVKKNRVTSEIMILYVTCYFHVF